MSSEQHVSTFEIRRRAPLHYWARADNARLAAYLLSQGPARITSDDLLQTGYGGTPSIALHEAFRREAAVAIELIVKAVIAQQIELGVAQPHVTAVRTSHDVPRLWQDANLPALHNQDKGRLILLKAILIWVGRYPAPKKDQDGWKDEAEITQYYDVLLTTKGGLKLKRPFSFEWDDFDRIYQIANVELWKLRSRFNL